MVPVPRGLLRPVTIVMLVAVIGSMVAGDCFAGGEAVAMKVVVPRAVKLGPYIIGLLALLARFFAAFAGILACISVGIFAHGKPEQVQAICTVPSAACMSWQGYQWFGWPFVFVKGQWPFTADRYEFSFGGLVGLVFFAAVGVAIAMAVARIGTVGDETAPRN